MNAGPPPPARTRRPLWPKAPARFTAAVLSGHSAMGLAFGALIYLVCLTGTVAVFAEPLRALEQPTPAAGAAQPGALGRIAAAALRTAPPGATFYVSPAPEGPARFTVTSYGAGGRKAWIAGADGRLLAARTPWTDWVADLHETLTAPAPWGALGVGLSGAALLALILSGVLAHPRIFRDAFRLRLSGSARLREAELHNRLSVWGLPFHVAVTLTGALFGLSNLLVTALAALAFHGDAARVYAPLTGPEPAADSRSAPLPDVDALVSRARLAHPGGRVVYVGLERAGTAGARYTVEVSAPGRLPRGEQVYFGANGRELGRGRFASGSLGLQAYSAAAQLHFGAFGGLPVRIAYAVLGAALTYVCATGVTIWLARRRDRGRPAPRLERAWAAWTWGAPAALLAAAALSRWLAPSLVFWLLALAALALTQALPSRRRA